MITQFQGSVVKKSDAAYKHEIFFPVVTDFFCNIPQISTLASLRSDFIHTREFYLSY